MSPTVYTIKNARYLLAFISFQRKTKKKGKMIIVVA